MIAPGALVILTPVVVGTLFGTRTLAGLLSGSLVSGVQMAVSMSNTGGAWDNAKKYVEVRDRHDDLAAVQPHEGPLPLACIRLCSQHHPAVALGFNHGHNYKQACSVRQLLMLAWARSAGLSQHRPGRCHHGHGLSRSPIPGSILGRPCPNLALACNSVLTLALSHTVT